jgi:hypothetical protein
MKNQLILNFLPIILIFLLVSYTDIFAQISTTILGKLVAILLIIFYIKQDKMLGLFVCLLVILFYQSDFVNSFDWLNKSVQPIVQNSKLSPKVIDPIFENMETLADNGLGLDNAYPLSVHKEGSQKVNINANMEGKKSEFRKTYCKKGHLIHKGQNISNENAEHIFPEIKHSNEHHKCNLCDNTCDFSFVNNKIDTEEILVKPKDSNDWVAIVWESMMSAKQ